MGNRLWTAWLPVGVSNHLVTGQDSRWGSFPSSSPCQHISALLWSYPTTCTHLQR